MLAGVVRTVMSHLKRSFGSPRMLPADLRLEKGELNADMYLSCMTFGARSELDSIVLFICLFVVVRCESRGVGQLRERERVLCT